MLALLAAIAAGVVAAVALPAVLPDDPAGGALDPVLVAGTALAQALGGLAVAAWATGPRRGRGGNGLVAEVGLHLRPVDALLGPGLALAVLPALGLLLSLLVAAGLLESRDVDNTSALFAGADGPAGFLLVALAVVVVAPVWEEVVFRGLLLGAVRRRAGTPAAVVVSSTAFGLLHAQPGGDAPALVLLTGTLGVVLALLVLRVGRLGPAVLLHATFNATAVLALAATS